MYVRLSVSVKFFTKRPSPFTSKELPVPLRRSSGPGRVLPGKIRDAINAEFGGSLFPHDFGVYSPVFHVQSHLYLLMFVCVCMYYYRVSWTSLPK